MRLAVLQPAAPIVPPESTRQFVSCASPFAGAERLRDKVHAADASIGCLFPCPTVCLDAWWILVGAWIIAQLRNYIYGLNMCSLHHPYNHRVGLPVVM